MFFFKKKIISSGICSAWDLVPKALARVWSNSDNVKDESLVNCLDLVSFGKKKMFISRPPSNWYFRIQTLYIYIYIRAYIYIHIS